MWLYGIKRPAVLNAVAYVDGHKLVDSADWGKGTYCTATHSESKAFLLNRFWPKKFSEYTGVLIRP
jgi:hypothetical protein